jgi:transcription initiation factor TFIID subunit 6
VTRTLAKTLSDPEKPLTSHFGAIVGLTALGPMAVQSILIPVLPAYLRALGIEGTPMDGGEQLPLETRKCYEALCDAVKVWRPHASEQDQVGIAPFFQNC